MSRISISLHVVNTDDGNMTQSIDWLADWILANQIMCSITEKAKSEIGLDIRHDKHHIKWIVHKSN